MTEWFEFVISHWTEKPVRWSKICPDWPRSSPGEVQRIFSDTSAKLKLDLYPRVFKGIARSWPAITNWSLDWLENNLGEEDVFCSEAYEFQKLRSFVSGLKSGVRQGVRFSPILHKSSEYIHDFDIHWINKMQTTNIGSTTNFFLGSDALVTDTHCAAPCNLFVQIFGNKIWRLFHPRFTWEINPQAYPFHWRSPIKAFEKVKRSKHCADFEFLEVTLEPGDILWVPPFWWHAVQNHSVSAALSFRWVDFSLAFSMSPHLAMLSLLRKHNIWGSIYSGGKRIPKADRVTYFHLKRVQNSARL